MLILAHCAISNGQTAEIDEHAEFRVVTWNIWHGGREDGERVGPQRVIEVIRESGAISCDAGNLWFR